MPADDPMIDGAIGGDDPGAEGGGARPGGFKPVIDWRRAAELLAQGCTVTAAARQVGASRSQLSRRRNHDPVFQGWVRDLEADRPGPLDPPSESSRLQALRERLHDAIDNEVQGGNVRVILWLADRLKLVTPTPAAAKQEPGLDELLGALGNEDLEAFRQLNPAEDEDGDER
jgi:hypothetical protein